MLVILMLFHGGLFDSSGILIIVRAVWVSPGHFLLHVGHGPEVSVIRFVRGSLNDDGMHIIQFPIANFSEWCSDLCFLRVHFCFALPSHDRVGIAEQLFKF